MNNNSFAVYLADKGLISINGPDAEKFLQGQLSCDLREITATQTRLGCYCNHQGRVLATFRLFYFNNQYYLALPKSILPTTLTQLKKYAVFSKVTLADASNTLMHIGYFESHHPTSLANFYPAIPTQIDQALTLDQVMIIRTLGSYARYELIGTPDAVKNLHAKLSHNIAIGSLDNWKLLDIAAGLANIYPETIGLFTPHMLNYPALNGVSFTKGCYVGQEIIARTEYRGQAKRHLIKSIANLPNSPTPGESLYNQAKIVVGTVVDAAIDSQNQYQMLVMLNDQEQNLKPIFWQAWEINLLID